MAQSVDFFQIYYREEHKQALFPFATPYYNEGLTLFFENDPICRLVEASEAEKIAVCSWKLKEKLRLRVGNRTPLTPEALQNGFQVLSFTRNSPSHRMIARATLWHPEFLPAIKLLWSKLGISMPHEVRNPIYFNHFCATSDIYKTYVKEFLKPAMELTKTDEELNKAMSQPSGYENLNKKADTTFIKKYLGLDYYPMAPFVLERCPSLWFTKHRIQVQYL